MLKKRKNNLPQGKPAISKRHLHEKIPDSDLGDQFGLHPTAGFPELQIPAIPHKVS